MRLEEAARWLGTGQPSACQGSGCGYSGKDRKADWARGGQALWRHERVPLLTDPRVARSWHVPGAFICGQHRGTRKCCCSLCSPLYRTSGFRNKQVFPTRLWGAPRVWGTEAGRQGSASGAGEACGPAQSCILEVGHEVQKETN